MRLVFSSFLVGVITSSYAVVNITETIRERKHFLEPKFDEEEFRAFLYQAVSGSRSIRYLWPLLCLLLLIPSTIGIKPKASREEIWR